MWEGRGTTRLNGRVFRFEHSGYDRQNPVRRAGFDGIELNYDLENDISPKAGPAELRAIRKLAEETGIAISGLCSFLYWPYSLSDNDPARRARGLELARLMIEAARELGTENLLTIAGSTYIPWLPEREPVAFDLCARRAREAIGALLPVAEKSGVSLNIENIFFNGYLSTPDEMNAFVDSFGSKHIGVHFNTGKIMLFQFPEHWIHVLGQRIRNVHFKEFSKKGTDHTLDSFRTLQDGTTNWPAVMAALASTSYSGYLTFEYFHPFSHYPEALIYQQWPDTELDVRRFAIASFKLSQENRSLLLRSCFLHNLASVQRLTLAGWFSGCAIRQQIVGGKSPGMRDVCVQCEH